MIPPTKARPLPELVADMLLLEHGDSEINHGEADRLLCEAILRLSSSAGMLEEARQLVEAYESVEKWYA